MNDERRQYPRIQVSVSVADHEEEQILGTISDLSISGCFILSENLLPTDSVVIIRFLIPQELEELTTKGRVASIRTRPHGMGIEFYAMAPEYRKILREFIKQEIGTVRIKLSDRREDRRISLILPIQNLCDEKIGMTKNVSLSGCHVKFKPGFDVKDGAIIDMKFILPEATKEIITKSKINRTDKDGSGIEFISIKDEDKRSIQELIKELSGDNII